MSFARFPSRLHTPAQQSIRRHVGITSLFSSHAAASKKILTPIHQYQRFNSPTRLLPTSPYPSNNNNIISPVNNTVYKIALLQNVQKKRVEEINNLQWIMDKMKIATLPSPTTTTTTPAAPPTTTQRTFQAMNRNARKAKKANHGKRPCSRDRRRWKIKKWANTSRRG